MNTTKSIRLDAAAAMVGGRFQGDGALTLCGFAALDAAGPEDFSFLARQRDAAQLGASQAGAVVVPEGLESVDRPLIFVRDPYLAAALIHSHLLEKPFVPGGVHPTAVIGADCRLTAEVSIGPLVALGARVVVGKRVTIEAGTVIGDDVTIGDDCLLKANVTVADGCRIGDRVTIHSGTVVGSDGYGYATNAEGHHVKRPQVGIVVIGDDVEIGANCCLDRAAFGETRVETGAKIDNLVQIAHNVVIGAHSLVVAQVGIAGSTTLGRNCVLGGASMINGHIHLGDRTMVAAAAGVHNSQPPGAVVGGIPAIPIKEWAKTAAIHNRLPEMYNELKKLRRQIEQLSAAMTQAAEKGDTHDNN